MKITETHAIRAANVLKQMGWDLTDYGENCFNCGEEKVVGEVNCPHCEADYNRSTIMELMKAIDAAVNG